MFRSMTCFKAYDIRGRLGEELDEEVAYRIGRAYAQLLQPRGVVVGGDARHSSAALKAALAAANPEDRIVVFGSFFTVGGVLHEGLPKLNAPHLK